MKRWILGSLVILGVLAPVTFVPAQDRATAEGHLQQADTVFIRIEIEGDSVRAVPDVVEVVQGQPVAWSTDIGEWTVRFTSPEPFGPGAVSQGIQGPPGQRRGQGTRPAARPGRYKYMIMVRDGERMRVRDPEIIIRPGTR